MRKKAYSILKKAKYSGKNLAKKKNVCFEYDGRYTFVCVKSKDGNDDDSYRYIVKTIVKGALCSMKSSKLNASNKKVLIKMFNGEVFNIEEYCNYQKKGKRKWQ